jgi:hypothetical protein
MGQKAWSNKYIQSTGRFLKILIRKNESSHKHNEEF